MNKIGWLTGVSSSVTVKFKSFKGRPFKVTILIFHSCKLCEKGERLVWVKTFHEIIRGIQAVMAGRIPSMILKIFHIFRYCVSFFWVSENLRMNLFGRSIDTFTICCVNLLDDKILHDITYNLCVGNLFNLPNRCKRETRYSNAFMWSWIRKMVDGYMQNKTKT